jgi:ribosome biogenesis protein UTP30
VIEFDSILQLTLYIYFLDSSAGHTGMSPQTLVDNVMAIAENAVPKIPRKWANIQVVALKTPESMALPIYNKTPETLLEIAAMAGYKPPKLSTSEDIDLAEKEFNGATKSSDSKADADKKRKGDLKSPLVRALKKQKKVEEEEKAGTKKADKKQASKQKRGAADVAVEDTPKESPTKKQKLQVAKKVEEVKPESTKKAKKETKVETPKDKKVEEVKPESTKKAKKETKVETPKETKKVAKKVEEVKPESAKKAKKETKVETPKETKKQKKDTPVKKSEEVKPKSAEKSKKEEENKNFIAAKKFKGSKKGYAFKMGKLGVGYYVDVKPTVDKMAIQAIMRLKNSRGGQKRNKYSK